VRYAIPTLFIILAFLVLQSWFNKAGQVSPEKKAVSFLADVKGGNPSKVVRHFGNNVCHCPKSKGWGAYLAFETDEEPNLAFLLGHPFNIGRIEKMRIASALQAQHGVIWEEPEDYLVNVQINFDRNKYRPVFIPLPMAYGKTMSIMEVNEFLINPQSEYWKSFTLRLRDQLKIGAIKFDSTNIDQDVRGDFKFLDKKSKESVKEKESMDKELSWYFIPKDAGSIILANGKTIGADQIENKFPRLTSMVMQLRIVRSAKLQPWSVAEFEIKSPAIEKVNGQIINLEQK
jgi:hypothetical protein